MKSKLNIKSILIIAIICAIILVCFNQSFAANVAKVNVETANIRRNPDSSSEIVEQASVGEEVNILEKSGEWYKVKYNNIEGYLRSDLLDVEGETTTATTTTDNITTENNTTSVETENQSQSNTTETANQENTVNAENTVNTENTTNAENTVNTNNESTTEEQNTQVSDTNTVSETENEKIEVNGTYICKENTKLKILPLIIGNDIKEIQKDGIVNVLEINNNWALVENESNRGWILVSKLTKQNQTATEANQENVNEEDSNKEDSNQAKETEQTNAENEQTAKETTMYINSEIVNLRADESTSSESIQKLSSGTEVTVISENNGWSKVKVNGQEGYVSSSLLSDRKPESVTSRSLEEGRQEIENTQTQEASQPTPTAPAQTTTQANEPSNATNNATQSQATASSSANSAPKQETKTETPAASNSSKGQEIVDYAKQYIGYRYVYGGTSPSGFDCSGFVQYVYKHFGISLNRTAAAQYSNGTSVSRANLKIGDLIMFGSSSSNIDHVGIYIGNGRIVHAANSRRGVTTDTINSGYYNNKYVGARRVIN